jgi:hypothetical protein
LKAAAPRWGVFFDPYARHCFWFETISLFRRSTFVAIDVLLFEQQLAKFIVFVGICALLLVFHLWLKPFREWEDNTAESISLTVLLILSSILCGYVVSPDGTVQVLNTRHVIIITRHIFGCLIQSL